MVAWIRGWLPKDAKAAQAADGMVAELRISGIHITENGTSSTAAPDAEGRVLDIDRVMFPRQYLGELQRAIADGAPVRGDFLRIPLDNFEWSRGYAERIGIT